jgi:hypothetical protein
MFRTMMLATVVVVIVAVGYFVLLGANEPGLRSDAPPPVAGAATDDSEAIAAENMSNRAASDAATDEAFESALDGEEPVQGNLDSSRAAADATGAVGAAAFTPEGFDRSTVVVAIEDSALEDAEKDRLMDLLAEIEPADGEFEPALSEIRAALELE